MTFPRRRSHFTAYELTGPRGWTEELIANVLGEPDIVISFPREEGKTPQGFYQQKRVLEAERETEVAEVVAPRAAAYEERRIYKLACKTDKRAIVLNAISVDDIVVEQLPANTLKIRALETFYERNAASGRPAPARLDEPTLRKIYLNFAVGQLVDYDGINAKLPEPLPKAELHKLISAEIEAKVTEAYPELGESNR